MYEKVSALLIAQPAKIRESLLVLLRSIPQIETVHQAADGPSALGMGLEVQPALVLVGYKPPDDEFRAELGQIKDTWPQARCVVFLDDEQDRRCVLEAGADVVLFKGIRAATLLEAIDELLSDDNPSIGTPRG